MKFRRAIYNIFFGLLSQLLVLAIGLIVPRLLLFNYGSEINGLFGTINNIYTYLALLQAGIGTSTLQALYKPVADNDRNQINSILAVTRRYYHKCAFYYFIGVAGLTWLLPLVIKSTISPLIIAGIIAFQGLASIMDFYLLAGVTTLLSAEGKDYVYNNITLLITILTNILKIILINLHANIIFIQIGYFAISSISVLIYLTYFRKRYPWLDLKSTNGSAKLKQRKSFLIHNAVYVIFNNTDMIILSIFCGLKVCSVYSIYSMVFGCVLRVINSIFNGLKFLLGQVYNENRSEYIKLHDAYKSYYCAFVFAMFSVCYILILPFISLYTKGVEDAQYIDVHLPFLFCLINLLSCCRSTENNLISLAFHATQTLPRTILEATINLGVSLVLVPHLGIYGCLVGTIAALLYRTNDIIIYGNYKILKRKPIQAFVTVFSNFALFAGVVLYTNYIDIEISNYMEFCIVGCILLPIFLIMYIALNSATNPKAFNYIMKLLKIKIESLREEK